MSRSAGRRSWVSGARASRACWALSLVSGAAAAGLAWGGGREGAPVANDVSEVRIDDGGGRVLLARLEMGGVERTLVLEPHSVRGRRFTVREWTDAGPRWVEPPPAMTYRGYVDGVAGSVAAITLRPDGIKGSILMPDAEGRLGPGRTLWSVEPVAGGTHRVRRASEEEVTAMGCGVTGHAPHDGAAPHDADTQGGRGSRTTGSYLLAELAYDTDFEFYSSQGGTAGVIEEIETIVSSMNLIFEVDTGITHDIVHVEVRSSSSDPYTTSNAQTLLSQVQTWWLNNGGGIARDVVQMISGRNFDGATIGFANISTICSNQVGYSVIQHTGLSTTTRYAVAAHELGHSWSAQHCSGSTCNLMCATLAACGGLGDPVTFGPITSPVIVNYAATRSCLGTKPAGNLLPWSDTFPTTSFNARYWGVPNPNVIISNASVSPPSAPNALNLDFAESVNTEPFRGDLYENIQLSYSVQRRAVTPGRSLSVSYRNSAGVWITINTITSLGEIQGTFTPYTHALPVGAQHMNLAVRFSVNGTLATDDWYIDNISLTGQEAGVECPADANGDTTLDAFDFNAFVDAFNQGNTSVADANADTTLDAFDFNAFVDLFNAGCP